MVYEPQLSRAQTEVLKEPHMGWLPNDGEIYGDDLCCLVGGFEDSWLAGAVLAGYVPSLADVALAIRASHLLALDEIATDESSGATDNVLREYRDLLALLETSIIAVQRNARDADVRAREDTDGHDVPGRRMRRWSGQRTPSTGGPGC